MSDPLIFSFDGEPLPARQGQSLAAALTDAGQRVFRHTAKGAPRGIFCGMGVCQDCLVSVDGVPNQRACMTIAAAGADVRRQTPRPALKKAEAAMRAASVPGLRELAPDVLIIGAGAGGLNAAIVAARAGAKVLILDERTVPGGQYFKQPSAGVALLDMQQSEGADLLDAARSAGAELLGGVEIWGAFAGPLLYALSPDAEPLIIRPRQLIVATGAYERPRMVPGWTLPGVMTTGAAQTLWRSYRSLPGKRVVVCGSGPLNLQVALELARGGADVRLVAESADSPLRRPASALALLLAGPKLALAGIEMLLGLRRACVPVRYRSELTRVTAGADGELRATFSCDGREDTLEVDALCMNDGFDPQNEVLRLLGANMHYDPTFGHLRCTREDSMLTSVDKIYAVGDCCGLGGAPAAAAEGRIAGAHAVEACGFVASEDESASRRDLRKSRRFQTRLWALHDPAPRSLVAASPDTIICRCEEVSLEQFRAGMADGSGHIGTVKRATRVGMGCCQGRYCGPVAARLMAETNGTSLEDSSYFAPRVPIKPVSIAVLLATQDALDAKV
ncbi:MAG: 2Fe-2S iron-sulfur cluster-binding protein [Congregibacter sp.]